MVESTHLIAACFVLTALGFAFVFLAYAALVVCLPTAVAFPCFLFGLLALPLCCLPARRFLAVRLRRWPFLDFLVVYWRRPCAGQALTFFAAAKKVSKESGFTPLILKRVPWLGGGSGASGIGVLAHFA
ncbi:hypothetical protein WN982_15375 [Paraburkholderia sp. IMGN_8]|uniref:hypothetical protein n=1 Tax=Paraburkholderia sp. IMGN_8 TaxID=3136564 RepID=UPI0031016100